MKAVKQLYQLEPDTLLMKLLDTFLQMSEISLGLGGKRLRFLE